MVAAVRTGGMLLGNLCISSGWLCRGEKGGGGCTLTREYLYESTEEAHIIVVVIASKLDDTDDVTL